VTGRRRRAVPLVPRGAALRGLPWRQGALAGGVAGAAAAGRVRAAVLNGCAAPGMFATDPAGWACPGNGNRAQGRSPLGNVFLRLGGYRCHLRAGAGAGRQEPGDEVWRADRRCGAWPPGRAPRAVGGSLYRVAGMHGAGRAGADQGLPRAFFPLSGI